MTKTTSVCVFRGLLFVLSLSVVVPYAGEANAYVTYGACGPFSGPRGNRTVKLDRCTIPVGSLREANALESINEINKIVGVKNRLVFSAAGSTCPLPSLADWTVHIAYETCVGCWGSLRNRTWETCNFPFDPWIDGELKKAKIVLDFGLDQNPQTPLDGNDGAAVSVLIHELGHFLGMGHESRFMSVMNEGVVNARYGQRPGHTESLQPDDLKYYSIYQGEPGAQADMAPSPWEFDVENGQPKRANNEFPEVYACPGDQVLVRSTRANKGLADIVGGHELYVFSTDTINPTADFHSDEYIWNIVRMDLATQDFMVNVPWLPGPGTYQIGLITDPWGQFLETDESNNATDLGRPIVVPAWCF